MGRRPRTAKELGIRAKQNGYQLGAHRAADESRAPVEYEVKVLNDQNKTLRLWAVWKQHETTDQTGETDPSYTGDDFLSIPSLSRGAAAPSYGELMDHVRWRASIGRGLIDKNGRITVQSMNTTMEWLFAGFTRVTGTLIEKELRSNVYKGARELVKEEVLISQEKPKHNFGKHELKVFQQSYWTMDDSVFGHPRNIIQCAWLMLTYCSTGARVGCFFPDPENDRLRGIEYRDITPVLMRGPHGSKTFNYRLDQRYVKNNKNPENTVFGIAISQRDVPMWDDPLFLLTLALMDEAFIGIRSQADLHDINIPEGHEMVLLRWKDSVKNLPVLRKCNMADGVTEKPLSKSTFTRIFKAGLLGAGFFDHLPTMHAIRRYVGGRVKNRYTEVDLAQLLTQSDKKVFGQYYLASMSSVDGKAAFTGEKSNEDLIEVYQSFRMFNVRGLAIKLLEDRKQSLELDPSIVNLKNEVKQLEDNGAEKKEIKDVRRRVASRRKALRDKELKLYRSEQARQIRDEIVTSRGKTACSNEDRCDTWTILKQLFPQRDRLARIMSSENRISHEERRECISDLLSLVQTSGPVLFLPGEEPRDGICPAENCSVEVASLKVSIRSKHVHQCCHKAKAAILGREPAELKYCYLCYDWCVDEDWRSHCASHLSCLNWKRCGSITYRHTLLRPSFCPFCLAKGSDPVKRLSTWNRDDDLMEHIIEAHLKQSSWPLECPLCRLELETSQAFCNHQADVHGYGGKKTGAKFADRSLDSAKYVWCNPEAPRKRAREEDALAEIQTRMPTEVIKPIATLKYPSGDIPLPVPAQAHESETMVMDTTNSDLRSVPNLSIKDTTEDSQVWSDALFDEFIKMPEDSEEDVSANCSSLTQPVSSVMTLRHKSVLANGAELGGKVCCESEQPKAKRRCMQHEPVDGVASAGKLPRILLRVRKAPRITLRLPEPNTSPRPRKQKASAKTKSRSKRRVH